MEFEWDENKDRTNLEKHGVNFRQASEVFSDEHKIFVPDNRKDYGEQRTKVIGKAINLFLSVIFTVRGTVIRLISARSAGKKERDLYNNAKDEL